VVTALREELLGGQKNRLLAVGTRLGAATAVANRPPAINVSTSSCWTICGAVSAQRAPAR